MLKKIICYSFLFLSCLIIPTKIVAQVTSIKTCNQLAAILKNNKQVVLYFYHLTDNDKQENTQQHRMFTHNSKLFNQLSKNSGYTTLFFGAVNIARPEFKPCIRHYNFTHKNNLVLFKNNRLVTNNYITGRFNRYDLESSIDYNLKKALYKPRVRPVVKKPALTRTYIVERPLYRPTYQPSYWNYYGPSYYGGYYSPCWGFGCSWGSGYGPYYAPYYGYPCGSRVGFGFSVCR